MSPFRVRRAKTGKLGALIHAHRQSGAHTNCTASHAKQPDTDRHTGNQFESGILVLHCKLASVGGKGGHTWPQPNRIFRTSGTEDEPVQKLRVAKISDTNPDLRNEELAGTKNMDASCRQETHLRSMSPHPHWPWVGR